MSEQLLDLINTHIAKIEKSLREDIIEIKTDLKDLKQSQMEMTKLIIKLSNVEDKMKIQAEICKEARCILSKHEERIGDIERELEPIKHFMKWKDNLSIKITASIILWFLGAIMAAYLIIGGK